MRSIISFETKGNFKSTEKFLKSIKNNDFKRKIEEILAIYGERGVALLASNTPIRTGATANSWSFEIEISNSGMVLKWLNSKMSSDGKTPVVILIINGHGTKNGKYVVANDFVKPVIEPLCLEASESIWKVVNSL